MKNKKEQIEQIIEELAPEAMIADGYDNAIVGIADVCDKSGTRTVVAYDKQKILKILQERDGMELEEAAEFFDYNVLGSYVGEGTPIYIDYSWALTSEDQAYVC
jgi:hypothetical protein